MIDPLASITLFNKGFSMVTFCIIAMAFACCLAFIYKTCDYDRAMCINHRMARLEQRIASLEHNRRL